MARKKWCVTYEIQKGEEQSEEIEVDESIAHTAAQVKKVLQGVRLKNRNVWGTKIVSVEEGACAPS